VLVLLLLSAFLLVHSQFCLCFSGTLGSAAFEPYTHDPVNSCSFKEINSLPKSESFLNLSEAFSTTPLGIQTQKANPPLLSSCYLPPPMAMQHTSTSTTTSDNIDMAVRKSKGKSSADDFDGIEEVLEICPRGATTKESTASTSRRSVEATGIVSGEEPDETSPTTPGMLSEHRARRHARRRVCGISDPEDPEWQTTQPHDRLVDPSSSHQESTRSLSQDLGIPEKQGQNDEDHPRAHQDQTTARKPRKCCKSLGHIIRHTLDPSVRPVRDTDMPPAFDDLKKLLVRNGLCLHQRGLKDSSIRVYEKQIVGRPLIVELLSSVANVCRSGNYTSSFLSPTTQMITSRM
jgi:hypothetical protein